MKKKILFEPGYDYIVNSPPEKAKYGRHGLTIRFLLEGEKGVIQFVLFTHWMPMIKNNGYWKPTFEMNMKPLPADIGYHSYKPKYKEQTKRENCEFLHGKDCYYDGSSLQAEEIFAILCNKGEKALWEEMERYYKKNLV